MAVTRISQSSLKQGLKKNRNFVAGIPPVLGRFESIATITVGSGGASSIEFTSIPGTYQHLQLRIVSRQSSGSTGVAVRVQVGNGSADTGSNYTRHFLYGDGSSALATANTSQTYSEVAFGGSNGDTANNFGAAVLDILDYANTSKNKTIRALSGIDNNGSGFIGVSSGLWMSTSAITVLKLAGSSGGNFSANTTAALYGIKAP